VRLAAAALALTGCSMFTVEHTCPQPYARHAAHIDTAVAAASIVTATGLWIATEHTHHWVTVGETEAAAGGALIVIGVLAAASAVYGYTTAARCR
jgi:hypothetical protein